MAMYLVYNLQLVNQCLFLCFAFLYLLKTQTKEKEEEKERNCNFLAPTPGQLNQRVWEWPGNLRVNKPAADVATATTQMSPTRLLVISLKLIHSKAF